MKNELKDPAPTATPLVSVLIAVWNGEKYIEACLQSVLRQNYQHLELIVVNDGSTDRTHEIVAEVIQKTPDRCILYRRQENSGPSKAFNTALGLASGEYICCLGADDEHLENFLSDTVEALSKSGPGVCSVYTDGDVIDAQGRRLCKWSDRSPVPWGRNQYKELLVANWLPMAGLLHRRSVFLEKGPWDEDSRNEDYHMWLRFARKYRFKKLSKIGFRYRVHGKNRSADDQHAARTIIFLTKKNSDLKNYLNFVWALLQRDFSTTLKLLSLLNLDLLGRTILRRFQIILKGRTPVTITVKRQRRVLEIIARSYSQKLWNTA